MIVIGIDPGKSGAIAILGDIAVSVLDIPLTADRDVDTAALRDILLGVPANVVTPSFVSRRSRSTSSLSAIIVAA